MQTGFEQEVDLAAKDLFVVALIGGVRRDNHGRTLGGLANAAFEAQRQPVAHTPGSFLESLHGRQHAQKADRKILTAANRPPQVRDTELPRIPGLAKGADVHLMDKIELLLLMQLPR